MADIGAAVSLLGGVDLLFSSGTLQYVPDPTSCLSSLLSVGATNLFIGRMALSSAGAFAQVQTSRLSDNGPGLMPSGLLNYQV